jgi:hypothetical protein
MDLITLISLPPISVCNVDEVYYYPKKLVESQDFLLQNGLVEGVSITLKPSGLCASVEIGRFKDTRLSQLKKYHIVVVLTRNVAIPSHASETSELIEQSCSSVGMGGKTAD